MYHPSDHDVPLAEEEFRLLRDFIHERFGLYFDDGQQASLRARLLGRLSSLDLLSFEDYYHYLRFGPQRQDELLRMVGHLTNNETYFFRERYQLDWYFSDVLPRRLKDRPAGEPVRVLCAGCSSGEEAYSLAIVHYENQFRYFGRPLEIHAIDLNPSRVRQAEQGEYEGLSFRATPPEAKEKYFGPTGKDGRLRLKAWLRAPVRFRVLNLMDLGGAFPGVHFDAVFCRNVLIYFNEATIQRAAVLFHKALKPGAPLFLGHAESLLGRTRLFRPERAPDFIFYVKEGA